MNSGQVALRRRLWLSLSSLLVVCWGSDPAAATGGRVVRQRVVTTTSNVVPQLVTTNVAIPVGVPVAQLGGVAYSYVGPQPQAQQSVQSNEELIEEIVRRVLERLEHPDTPGTATALQNNCVRCHGPDRAEGRLRVDQPIRDPWLLNEIMFRLTTDDPELRMPKGADVSPEERGKMIRQVTEMARELIPAPAPATEAIAPPEPQNGD